MIYIDGEVISVNTDWVTVNNPSAGEIMVYLPSVISRMPIVGDHINYDKDDVDRSRGMFIGYYNTAPVVPSGGGSLENHQHQLLSDDMLDDMNLSAEQKLLLKSKLTGGVHE